jgi:sRNA-binding carbon storage regulator CsrA
MAGLVLSRSVGEAIVIQAGDKMIRISLACIRRKSAHIRVEAAMDVRVDREEVLWKKEKRHESQMEQRVRKHCR